MTKTGKYKRKHRNAHRHSGRKPIIMGDSVAVASSGGVAANAGGIAVGGNFQGNITQVISQSYSRVPALHQLHQAPADFTGREQLTEEILADFARANGVAISGLTGMAGVGKTALGLVVAQSLEERYPDAQIFLDLKGTTAPLAPSEILRYIILSLEPSAELQTDDVAQLSATLRSILHDRHVLLFLDNARSADQVGSISVPETCALLITSRWQFAIPGLNFHRLNVLSEEEAVNFLLALNQRIGENAAALASACGYLPLALRIAGSFLQINSDWPAERYLAQLSEYRKRLIALRDARQGASLDTEPDVTATFELSYQQLNIEEKRCWCRLGIFSTSFTSAAAAHICETDEVSAHSHLALLHRYSLLEYDATTTRYHLHDLLAEFALNHLEEDDERRIRYIHAHYYWQILNLVNQMVMHGGDETIRGLRIFDIERTNIYSGQEWAASHSQNDAGCLELCGSYGALGETLRLRLHPSTYIRWIEVALVAVRESKNREAEAGLLANLGLAYSSLGKTDKALRSQEHALEIAREIGNRKIEGASLNNIGIVYKDLGESRRSIEYYEPALAIVHEMGDLRTEGSIVGNLGIAHKNLGSLDEAMRLFNKALSISRETGNRPAELATLNNLGSIYGALGDDRAAIDSYEAALTIARELRDRRTEGAVTGNIGMVYKNRGNIRKAIELYGVALAIAQEIDDVISETIVYGNLAMAYTVIGDSSRALDFYEKQLRLSRETGDRRSEGNALAKMGTTLYELGQKERGIECLKDALGIFEDTGSPTADWARQQLKAWDALS